MTHAKICNFATLSNQTLFLQITRHASQHRVEQSTGFYPTTHLPPSRDMTPRDPRPHQYPTYVATPQVLYNPAAFAREMELSSHNVTHVQREVVQPVRVPVVRDLTHLSRDFTHLPRDVTQLSRDVTHLSRDMTPLPRERVQHDITEFINTSYHGPNTIPHFPTTLPPSEVSYLML